MWNCMLEKDSTYSKLRNHNMLDRHPCLVQSYRTILLDWLSEVSQECKFHRETYHLALDFIDRYLSAQSNVGKLQLQLIGITCLFLAAKFEEIRPPTVMEFADLTDGACRADDIIENEVVILSAINWEITPMTPNNWLNIYMQILLNISKVNEEESLNISNSKELIDQDENSGNFEGPAMNNSSSASSTKNDSFILPANNGTFKSVHKRIAAVIDLALLHIESLRFSNSILTASALTYFIRDSQTVRQCTGFEPKDLDACVRWLKPFVETIKEIREPVFFATCRGESHSTQMHTHIATEKLLEKVFIKLQADKTRPSLKRKACSVLEDEFTQLREDFILSSPSKPSILLTPPNSAKKRHMIH